MVVVVAFRAMTLASNKLSASVIGRRRRSSDSEMMVVVCDALPVAYLLRQRIALSIFVPKILDADVMVEAMVMLRLSQAE
jgi:hypothetical protein